MSILLASGHKTAYRIVCAADADLCTRYAAQELQSFLWQMTGAAFPLISSAAPEDHDVILVGQNRFREDRLSGLGGEGVLNHVCKCGTVTLCGNTPRATLYSVYAFLERLGCRWFTQTVSRVPKRDTLTVEPGHYTSTPALEYREPFYTEAFDGVWAARNRVNGEHMTLTGREGGKVSYFPEMFVHTFYPVLPPETYFNEHPEYYSEIDGKRTCENAQLCLTNPDVLRLYIENARKIIKAHPECRIFSVSQNDCYKPCECAQCKKVDEEEGSHAGTLIRFVNAVADALGKEFPDVWFDTLAYQYTRPAPRITKPRPNVIVRLCSIECCFTHPLGTCDHFRMKTDPTRNANFLTDLEDWSKICDRLYIWDYTTNFASYLLPYPNFEVLAPNLRFFLRHNVKGVFEEGSYPKGGGGYCAELEAYVLAKLMWDPSLDENLLADEFLTAVYRNAAPVMKRIFAAYRAQIERENFHLEFAVAPDKIFLDRAFIASVRALFEEAKLAADDEQTLREVRKAELWQRYLELTHTPKSDERDAAIDAYVADCKSFGIGALVEWQDIDACVPKFKEMDMKL